MACGIFSAWAIVELFEFIWRAVRLLFNTAQIGKMKKRRKKKKRKKRRGSENETW